MPLFNFQLQTNPLYADVRLDLNSTTSVKLTGMAGSSKQIEVNKFLVDCTTDLVLNKTDNLITSTGANAGSAMSVSTFYYVYVSNHLATYAPSSVRASTTAPTNGYLGASGNALNWRYVGDCYLWSDGNFYDSDTQRLVRSEFNVIWKGLKSYNTTSAWTGLNSSWRELNSGAGHTRGYFLGDGKSAISPVAVMGNTNPQTSSYAMYFAIGYDATNATTGTVAIAGGASVNFAISASAVISPTKGLHYLTMVEGADSSGYGYFYGLSGTGIWKTVLNVNVPV